MNRIGTFLLILFVSLSAGRTEGFQLKINRADGQQFFGRIEVREGVEVRVLKLSSSGRYQKTTEGTGVELRESEGKLLFKVVYTDEDPVSVTIRIRNQGGEPRLLDVGFFSELQGPDVSWWDGRKISIAGEDQMQYLRTLFRLPLSVAVGKTSGIAVGLDPHELFSMFSTASKKSENGLAVGLRVRVVVDPGGEVSIPYSLFGFSANFGYLDAVQRFFDAFPDEFKMATNLRAEMLGGGGYLNSSRAARHLQIEETRRFGQGWEWSYCPPQKPGDWYPDERFWDPVLGYAGDKDVHQNVVQGSLEDFRKDMRERFHGGWASCGLAYFLLPYSAEEKVLASFPESEIVDAAGKSPPPTVGWTKAGIVTRSVFPWGNAYGRELVREIHQIAEDFQPSAIAFDEAYGCDRQYGKEIQGDPARGWDDTGVFVSTQVALARLGDEIHKLNVKGYRMATVFNKPWGYQTATRADVAMHEWVPFSNVDSILSLRMLMGHKPLSWWDGFHPDRIINWESMSVEQLKDAISRAAAYIRLSSLRYGAFPPTQQNRGIKSLVDLMPVLRELLSHGWQPVPAARLEGAWISRYGRDVNSFIAIGNPSRKHRKAELDVNQAYLGKGVFLYSDYHGRPVTMSIRAGQTRISLPSLSAHGDLILRASVQIQREAPEGMQGSVEGRWNVLTEGTIQATWKGGPEGRSHIRLRIPEGARCKALSLNDESIPFEEKNGIVEATIKEASEAKLILTYQPAIAVNCAPEQIAAFPFTSEGGKRAEIVIPEGSSEKMKMSAQRISSYFEWLERRKQEPSLSLMDLVQRTSATAPHIQTGKPDSSFPTVQIRLTENEPSLSIDAEGNLVIEAGSDAGVDRAVLRLLELLDEVNPFYGGLPDSPIYRRAGLVGGLLE